MPDRKVQCPQPESPKTEAVARRVVAILEVILRETNHGEIAIRVTNGTVEVAGGPRYRIT